jgi:UDP-N-acetylmuramoyl-tripeptide--D-alanyl-D-alanine ligase
MIAETPSRGRKVAVLGEMLELGARARQAHLDIGALAAQSNLALLIVVGSGGSWIGEGAVGCGMEKHLVLSVANAAEAGELLRRVLFDGDFVLLKGSRGVKLETILDGFKLG